LWRIEVQRIECEVAVTALSSSVDAAAALTPFGAWITERWSTTTCSA
jgi:hypothetical protein